MKRGVFAGVLGLSNRRSSVSGEKLEAKEGKDISGLVNFSDADLLLEKMLGEHESAPVGPEEAARDSQGPAPGTHLAPTEAKISDVDMLEAFGGCLTPEESSNPSIAQPEPEAEPPQPSPAQGGAEARPSEAPGQREAEGLERVEVEERSEEAAVEEAAWQQQEEEETAPLPGEVESTTPKQAEDDEEEDDDDNDENTYVLPADMEEWSKLFELVASQVSARTLADHELEEARGLLDLEGKILSEELEKQIQVFNRLCALANVQMT